MKIVIDIRQGIKILSRVNVGGIERNQIPYGILCPHFLSLELCNKIVYFILFFLYLYFGADFTRLFFFDNSYYCYLYVLLPISLSLSLSILSSALLILHFLLLTI